VRSVYRRLQNGLVIDIIFVSYGQLYQEKIEKRYQIRNFISAEYSKFMPPKKHISYSFGETEIELVCIPHGQKFEGKGMFICFVTDKLDTMQKLALERGLNPSDIQNPDPENCYFYVYDPSGVSVQLKQKL
jgi:hypothetical protein